MNLYLNDVAAPSVLQGIFFIHVNSGAKKELNVDCIQRYAHKETKAEVCNIPVLC